MGLGAGAQNLSRTAFADLGLSGRVMWVDGTANIDRITNQAGVQDVVDRCKAAHFTTLVLDVKPVIGEVLYNSRIAAHLVQWKGITYPNFDVLKAFIATGHKAGLHVAASFNVFAEGHKLFHRGLGYRMVRWQSTSYDVERDLVASDGSRLPVRADADPPDLSRSLVHSDNFVMTAGDAAAGSLAVQVNGMGQVEGMINPALLGTVPLATPEDGNCMILTNVEAQWADKHLRVGDSSHFEAQGRLEPEANSTDEPVTVFTSPNAPDVRAYEISLIQEVARNYSVDSIVVDRMRYADIYNDFGSAARRSFENWLGRNVAHWPDDVLKYNPTPGGAPLHGPLFRSWLEFRATTIRNFLASVVSTVHAINPAIEVGAYVGSWYHDYYQVGVNWGSDIYPLDEPWASPGYIKTGYAGLLDWICTGCYYPLPERVDALRMHREEGATVEAASALSDQVVRSATPVYAGVYALDYSGRPAEFARALNVAARNSEGVMLFDISHIYNYGWWPLLERTFSDSPQSPDTLPGLISELRGAQDAVQ